MKEFFDGTAELQKNWWDLIVNLFHYKCGSDECSVEEAKYGHKPLYVKTANGAQRGVLLHRVQAGGTHLEKRHPGEVGISRDIPVQDLKHRISQDKLG